MKIISVIGRIAVGKTTFVNNYVSLKREHEHILCLQPGSIFRTMFGEKWLSSKYNPHTPECTQNILDGMLGKLVAYSVDAGMDLVLDGYPRSPSQVEFFSSLFSHYKKSNNLLEWRVYLLYVNEECVLQARKKVRGFTDLDAVRWISDNEKLITTVSSIMQHKQELGLVFSEVKHHNWFWQNVHNSSNPKESLEQMING